VFDASGAAGRYLCAGGRDLATEDGLRAAVLSYNNSGSYLRIVLNWMLVYERGAVVVPGFTGTPEDVVPGGTRPPPGTTVPPVPPGTTEPPPASSPAPPPPTTPEEPGEPAPPTSSPTPPPPGDVLTGTVGGLVCVVDGVLDGATGLLGGLLGAPVTPAPDENCP
jgi:hypothetical protein